ncbi:hypothetical protein E8E13_003539 [Curvularia kusanoi]|uniref:Fucose-specific lectin n=1 Tax=Curvularia kusanoi TaxID=90978 RepID=A0A9P4WBA2_CURKU|nr:hypothetical protein E8E13_003539 [Curvularia kusanoi]
MSQQYGEGFSTEKQIAHTTCTTIGTPTPDYSAPEVVPDQEVYPAVEKSMSPSSHGVGTLGSPHPRQYAFLEHMDTHDEHISRLGSGPPQTLPKDSRKCGLKRRTFCMLIGCVIFWLVALGAGLGAGLGIGLSKKHHEIKMDPFCRDIRYMKYTKGQKWIGGGATETVANNAKNGTAISAVSYAANSTQFFHVFYVGVDNMIKQVTQTNESTSAQTWTEGPLSKQNLQVYSDSPSTGLQACWKGNYYGDTDYKKFPTVSGDVNDIPFDNRLGMNIWYASDNSTFQQYAWIAGSPDWKFIQKWQGFNTQAGVGCYSWGTGTTQYAMMVSKGEDVEFYWKDTDTNTSTIVQDENHPYNVFVNASKAAIPDVWPSSSLGYTTFFYTQLADRSIRGYDINYAAENTSYPMHENFTVATPAEPLYALGGTHLTVTSMSEKNDKGETLYDSLYVFFQQNGYDITVATRRLFGGEWTIAPLKIPDV